MFSAVFGIALKSSVLYLVGRDTKLGVRTEPTLYSSYVAYLQ